MQLTGRLSAFLLTISATPLFFTDWIFELVHSPENTVGIYSFDKVWEGQLVCDFLIYHTGNRPYIKKIIDSPLWKRKLEFFTFHGHNACLALLTPNFDAGPLYTDDETAFNPELARRSSRAVFRYRYDAGLMLLQLVSNGQIISRTQAQTWFVYMDFDTVFTDKTFTFENLLKRVEQSLYMPQTTEERACSQRVPCDDSVQPILGGGLVLDEVGLILTPDFHVDCERPINSGVMLYRATDFAGFFLESVLSLWNQTYPNISDGTDQGRVLALMQEVYDFDLHRMMEMHQPFDFDLWSGENPKLVRRLNHAAAQKHTILGKFYERWFPNSDKIPMATAIVIVPNKFMNAFGTNLQEGIVGTSEKIALDAWDCDAPIVHFAGCHSVCYESIHWREKFWKEECQSILPFIMSDNGTDLFNLDEWIEKSVNKMAAPQGKC